MTKPRKAWTRSASVAMTACSLLSIFTVVLLACGPFVTRLETVQALEPARPADYSRGDLGIVRPRLARRYLVQAFRAFEGRSSIAPAARPADSSTPSGFAPDESSPLKEWVEARDRVLGPSGQSSYMETSSYYHQYRVVDDTYQQILNCPDDAFVTAARTLTARIQRYGASSPQVRDWTRAQSAVFSNCGGKDLVLPEAPGADADSLSRADRAYQVAAAYFYGLQYEEAAQRFRAIAVDAASPWRPYGRYLAARATIRMATIDAKGDAARDILARAEAELKTVLDDREASALHASTRGLLDFIDSRLRFHERLHAVSKRLADSPQVTEDDFEAYRWLMDHLVGNTVNYDYASVPQLDRAIENDELTDWILALQGNGDRAAERALARWQATRAPRWLVVALWQLSPEYPSAALLIERAAAIDRSSPAFPTLAFLRVRALARAGRADEARAVLATLPTAPEPGFQAEAVNLIRAERLMTARTLDEFLLNAPRQVVSDLGYVRGPGGQIMPGRSSFAQPVFDEDSAVVLTDRMPLRRLADAVVSPILPARLRVRVAMAAFTRAVLLRRDDTGGQVALVLRQLARHMADDLDRYIRAGTPEDRHRAGVLLLLRAPGMRAKVWGLDDDESYTLVEPVRKFDHLFRRNWWCGFDGKTFEPEPGFDAASNLVDLLYADRQVPYPEFISPAERSAAEREHQALIAVGPARSYLAAETLEWARLAPKDPDLAEALALVVEGWRWGCGDEARSSLAQRAFQTLHRQYPTSEWARRTRYWYK